MPTPRFQIDTGNTLNTSLQDYYKLEDVTDFFSTSNLTNNNSVAFAAAKVNNGADLGASNTNKSLSIGSNLGLGANPSALTFEFWMKLQSEITTGSWDLLGLENTGAGSVNFRLLYNYNAGSQNIQFGRQRIGFAFDNTTYASGALGTVNWNHIVLTYDGVTVVLYFNNSNVASVASAVADTGNGSPATRFSIGDFQSASFTSSIYDECGVWSKALSTTEISDLYNGGRGQTMIFLGGGRMLKGIG